MYRIGVDVAKFFSSHAAKQKQKVAQSCPISIAHL